MMDLKKVKDVIDLMKENDLVEVEIVDGESKIHLKRPQAQTAMMQPVAMAPGPVGQPVSPPSAAAETAESAEESGLVDVKSPIIGTFYQAPSPDSEPFASVGTRVESDTVVCIIEAMKVMNEIKAETGGTVVEVCCKDGQAVEYGQVLFRVRP